MKIQLSSTLPFSPVQLDSRQAEPRRAVGELYGRDGRREFRTPVYEFRHGDDDQVSYLVDPRERSWLDGSVNDALNDTAPEGMGEAPCKARSNAIDAGRDAGRDPGRSRSPVQDNVTEAVSLDWLGHDDSLTYKPYAFLVMNAMAKLVGNWDGVIYQTPSGERLRDTVRNATLQVVDACVCNRLGLWVMVNLNAEKNPVTGAAAVTTRQSGWVPLSLTSH